MCSNRRKISFLGVWVLLTITCIKAFPGDRQSRQEDEDEDTRVSTISPINFGAQVAQIITGALTGNIDSIIKGSFGFIEDPNVNRLSHNTWETLKGNPTQTPPWASTTTVAARTERATEAATAAPPPPPEEPAPVKVSSGSPPPLSPEVESAQSGPSSSALSPADLFFPGSSSYPTRPPTRTRQPTYATLAPLSVIEGAGQTEPEPEESSTTAASTDPDEDDEDEAESRSGEVTEASTTVGSSGNVEKEATTRNPESYSVDRSTTVGVTDRNVEAETTTEDEDDQVDLEAFYST